MSLPMPRCTACAAVHFDADPNSYVEGTYTLTDDGYSVHRVSGSGLAGSYLVDTLDDVLAIADGLQPMGDDSAGVLVSLGDDRLAILTEAGAAWSRARELEREAAAAVYALIADCVAAGLSESEVARRVGVDRMTVRRAVGKL